MNQAKIDGFVKFLEAALPLGAAAVSIVQSFAVKTLTKEENVALKALWSENRARTAVNAGIKDS